MKSLNINGALLDADKIATWQHLFFSAIQAYNSLQDHVSIARTIDVELILHVAAERQIKTAFTKVGIQPDTIHYAVLILTPPEKGGYDTYYTPIEELFSTTPQTGLLALSQSKIKMLENLYDIKTAMAQNKELKVEDIVRYIINQGALIALEKTW